MPFHRTAGLTEWPSRVPDAFKTSFSWLFTTGQTVRWATQEVVLRRIIQELSEVGTAADIGCGGGRYVLDLLAPRAREVIGVEFDAHSALLAERRVRRRGLDGRIGIVRARAEALPLPAESLELLLCTEVLEHLPEPVGAIRELSRVMRRGGRLVVSIPIPPDPCPNPAHLHDDFTPPVLEALLVDSGLRILQRATCMFAVSRAVLRMTGWARIPLPLVPLCRLEQVTSSYIPWPWPYDFVCVALKQ